ncbi:hypothetical protein Q5752_004457 [Cryptotrichosporon argae]
MLLSTHPATSMAHTANANQQHVAGLPPKLYATHSAVSPNVPFPALDSDDAAFTLKLVHYGRSIQNTQAPIPRTLSSDKLQWIAKRSDATQIIIVAPPSDAVIGELTAFLSAMRACLGAPPDVRVPLFP